MIELGGNITLSGFQDRDYAELIVVKKIVGRYARRISDQHSDFKRLDLTLTHNLGVLKIEVSCTIKNQTQKVDATGNNLFVVLDEALKKVFNILS